MKKLSRDEMIRAMAEVVAGLQVPVSLGMMLGAAREPWGKLHEIANGGFGWYGADQAEANFREVLADEVVRRVETGQYVRRDGGWVWVPHNVQGPVDVTPDPLSWPECPTCGAAYVLRHALLVAGGHTWVWQRDCKHRNVEPTLNPGALSESSMGDDVNNSPSTEVLT